MSPVEPTDIELFGILIQEPVTAATDLLTASVCYYAFYKLYNLRVENKANQFFAYYFLFMALGITCAAFFSHAFLYLMGTDGKILGWIFILTGTYCMENSALLFYQQEVKSTRFNGLSLFFKTQYLLFVTLLIYPPTRFFKFVQIHTLIGILGIVFPMFMVLFRKTQKMGYRKVLIAFSVSFIMGLVFNIEITFHQYFNYHDVSHVIMALSCFLLFLGGLQLAKESHKV